jgi:hypothetical protein
MSSPLSNGTTHDRKTFLLFLALTIFTASNFIFFVSNPVSFGLIAVVWGLFGFFRLIYLTHYQMNDVPKMLNLPIQILFGTGKKEQEKRKLTIKRMARPDVTFWLMGSICFMFWALFNNFYPNNIDLHKAFILPESTLSSFPEAQIDPYAILTKISYLGVLVTLVFVTLTYSQKRTHLKWGYFLLTPITLIGLYGVTVGDIVNSVRWPDVVYFRGAGFYQGDVGTIMTSSLQAAGLSSPFVNRFLELGSIGAYGVYVLGAPAAVMLIKAFVAPNRSYLKPLLGLFNLLLLALIDIFAMASIWASFTFVLLICLAALSWGHTVRYKV